MFFPLPNRRKLPLISTRERTENFANLLDRQAQQPPYTWDPQLPGNRVHNSSTLQALSETQFRVSYHQIRAWNPMSYVDWGQSTQEFGEKIASLITVMPWCTTDLNQECRQSPDLLEPSTTPRIGRQFLQLQETPLHQISIITLLLQVIIM